MLVALTLTASTAAAQQAPFNEVGVTMGHWHIASKDVEANKKLSLAMAGKLMPAANPGTRNTAPVVDIPGVQIRFAKADAKQAPTRGRVLDHIGFDVKDHAAFVKKIQSEGIKLDEPPRKSPTGSTITYITDPSGTRIEIVQRAPLGQPVQP